VNPYLEYGLRRIGPDHDLYYWSVLQERSAVRWPNGASLAVWVVVSMEWFRFDSPKQPFKVASAPTKEYPDYREWTQRDYGNRIGLFRVMDVLDTFNMNVTAAVNSEVFKHRPFVIEEANRRHWEFIGHGETSSVVFHDGMSAEAERATISQSLATLRTVTGQPVVGWLSPGLSESARTLDLLAEQGIEYVCDWVNDQLPYRIRAGIRPMYAMPFSYELDDVNVITQLHHTPADYARNISDSVSSLSQEAKQNGGRVMCISIHPWFMGQPHRIRYLREACQAITNCDGVWMATGREILEACRHQLGDLPERGRR